MAKKTPQEIADTWKASDQKNIRDAAEHVLLNTLGKYLHETISSGAEPSRSGLRAWALAQAAEVKLLAPWYEAVVELVDGNSAAKDSK